jgi:polysaccharide export outer membrane protein
MFVKLKLPPLLWAFAGMFLAAGGCHFAPVVGGSAHSLDAVADVQTEGLARPARGQFVSQSLDVRAQGDEPGHVGDAWAPTVPQELQKITLPAYRVAPPDILLIDAVKLVPKPPYRIEPLDTLQIVVSNALPDQPIGGLFGVDPGGMVHLGPTYGSVRVSSLTIPEAVAAIDVHLRAMLREPLVSVSLGQTAGQQQIVGEHLIGPDGTVNLGTYGKVYVAGMTIPEVRAAIEGHLARYLESPKVSVQMFAYNSMVYYVILEGGGQGDRVIRIPVTGNETVLDAIGNERIVGFTQFQNSHKIWIARPAPSALLEGKGVGCDQILPVDWRAITAGGQAATNYQILPGDRVFIGEDRMMAFNVWVEKMTQPFERMFGFTLVGAQTVQLLQRFPRGFTQGGGGFF